ncbi:MAG: DUF2142 domain-containing protein [Longispora sp.]|nr:DUF2142 domain-containing protein [Longispora sp. (in: high G+C Gram-positive bacteria)]
MRRIWLLAFVGYFMLGMGWVLGVPVNGTYDEVQHIPRAYGVVTGQIYADGYFFDGPASLLPGNLTCFEPEKLAAGCQTAAPRAGTPQGDETVRWPSAAARYSPLYYAAVGLPLALSPDRDGIIAARVLSVLLSALLLATAMALAARAGNRLLIGALLLVTTPIAMNLNGAINPNGLEISAGILAWTALLLLVRGSEVRPARSLFVAFGASAALLLTIRHMGPVLLGVIILACLLFARPGRVRALFGQAVTRWTLGAIAAAGALGVLWMVTSAVDSIPPDPNRAVDLSTAGIVEQIVRIRTPFYLTQVIGQFSYGELTLPGWVAFGWYALVAALVIPALLLANRRYRLVWLGTAVACFGMLAVLELWFVPRLGWYSHGRYAMPAGVGLVLMAAFVRGLGGEPEEGGGGEPGSNLGGEFSDRFVQLVAVGTACLHIYALVEVTLRYREQISSMPSPAYSFVLGVTGAFLLVAMSWRNTYTQLTPTRHNPDTTNNLGRSSEDETRTVAH